MQKTACTRPDHRLQIKQIMNQYVGVMRNAKGLEKAHRSISDFCTRFDDGVLIQNAESRNIADIAILIVKSAIMRLESRGLHYIREYPEKKKDFAKDTIIHRKES